MPTQVTLEMSGVYKAKGKKLYKYYILIDDVVFHRGMVNNYDTVLHA